MASPGTGANGYADTLYYNLIVNPLPNLTIEMF